MSTPIELEDGTRLYPPNVHLIDDGMAPREAAQWSLQGTDNRARPLSLADAIEVTEELRLELVLAHVAAIEDANEFTADYLRLLRTDIDGHADETVVQLVKIGQFVEQATHDLAQAPIGAEIA